MAYDTEPSVADCYPDTAVLINKFDIHDTAKLAEVENALVTTRNAQWLHSPASSSFDFEHYKAIHRFLFSDLYDWAGTPRQVNLRKKATSFTPFEQIEPQADLIFKRLAALNYLQDLSHTDRLTELVDFYCATNLLHPFREGNGRTQRTFLTQLLALSGYSINWARVDTDLLMIATIQAASGVTDLLFRLFDELLSESI